MAFVAPRVSASYASSSLKRAHTLIQSLPRISTSDAPLTQALRERLHRRCLILHVRYFFFTDCVYWRFFALLPVGEAASHANAAYKAQRADCPRNFYSATEIIVILSCENMLGNIGDEAHYRCQIRTARIVTQAKMMQTVLIVSLSFLSASDLSTPRTNESVNMQIRI